MDTESSVIIIHMEGVSFSELYLWRLDSCKECVITHWTKQLILKIHGTPESSSFLEHSAGSIEGARHKLATASPPAQILAVVALGEVYQLTEVVFLSYLTPSRISFLG